MGLEVALQVRPADLAARERQVVVGPPAVRGHDPVRGRRAARVAWSSWRSAATWKTAMLLGEGAPQRALGAFSRQPVSSMFSARERRTRPSSCS